METIELRALRPADAAALVGLSAEAGWNQTADDWRLIIDHGGGEGMFGHEGRPLASACAVPLTAASRWVCMVLVTPAARRQGHATRLMARQIAAIEAAGRVPGLDATELGRPVYEKLGFRPLFPLSRWRAPAPRWTEPRCAADLRQAAPADIAAIAAYDAGATGSDRQFLLEHLARRLPRAAWIALRDGRIAGFAMGRDGLKATSIGPVVADTPDIAAALAAAAGASVPGPAVIDLRDGAPGLATQLEAWGFTRERGFTRMVKGDDPALDRTEALYAPAGPEFG